MSPDQQPRSADTSSADSKEISQHCERIEVHVEALHQMFNSIDPSPVKERDLSPNVEEFIVSWARDTQRSAAFELIVHVDDPSGVDEAPAVLHTAVRAFFSRRALYARRRLRQLLRVGRTSLLIGLVALAFLVSAGSAVETALAGKRIGVLLRESLLIGGWVAMWRPLEIFLYDWWPIRDEARLFDRLSAMAVRIEHHHDHERGDVR